MGYGLNALLTIVSVVSDIRGHIHCIHVSITYRSTCLSIVLPILNETIKMNYSCNSFNILKEQDLILWVLWGDQWGV